MPDDEAADAYLSQRPPKPPANEQNGHQTAQRWSWAEGRQGQWPKVALGPVTTPAAPDPSRSHHCGFCGVTSCRGTADVMYGVAQRDIAAGEHITIGRP